MLRAASKLLGLGLTVLTAPALAREPAARTGDEAAFREAVRKYVDAREAQDPKAIETLFTGDADQLVSDGTRRRGHDAPVRGMLAGQSSPSSFARSSARSSSEIA